ncbi:MAG: outer membrane beta-barrel protein [Acidobacteriota bacterium]
MRGRSFINKSSNVCPLALAGLIVLISVVSVHAQTIPNPDPPSNPGMRLGAVVLSPTIRLSEFGYDSNVLNLDDSARPVGDFVATLSPAVNAWFRFAHVRVSSHSQFDLYYYKTLPDLRAVDKDNAAQVDLLVNRMRLFVVGGLAEAQRRQSLEIDAIAQRQNKTATLGADVRLSGKTFLGVSVTRASLKYAPNSLYLGTDLGTALNYKSSGETVGLRYAATPLTTFAVTVSHNQTRFDNETDRNSSDLTIIPSVEFSPFALVSGRAAVGFIKRTFDNATTPFAGSTASVDLSYILLGRTRFTFAVNRRLEYSYLPGLNDYLVTGATVSVTQRLGDAWDLGGSFGPARLSYRQAIATSGQAARLNPDETVVNSGLDLGYNVKRTRVGLYAEHIQRDSDGARGFKRVRLGTTVKYEF